MTTRPGLPPGLSTLDIACLDHRIAQVSEYVDDLIASAPPLTDDHAADALHLAQDQITVTAFQLAGSREFVDVAAVSVAAELLYRLLKERQR